ALPTLTTTPTPAVEQFTVNFTITNLRYREEMGTPNSKTFNATEIAITTLMERILKSGSIGPVYLGCKVTSLRPVKNREETGMDSICTYRNDSTTPVFDRVKVYHEIVNRTQGFTRMGPYKLERYSLYVNGNYHEGPLEATVSPTPSLVVEQFTVNFTVTNLRYKPAMGIPNSKVFNTTEVVFITLLGRYLNRSSIGPAFLGCEVTTLRRLKNGDETGMDSVCSYRKDSTTPAFDRVKVYHEIVNQTRNFTQMGPYKLERYSLYVNAVLPTLSQTPRMAVEQFTMNFTITNLKYKKGMGTPNSKAFSATEMVVTTLLSRILPDTSIGPAYLGCRVTNLTSVRNGDETGIDSICTYRNDSATPVFDRVKVYHEIVNKTKGFTKMGPYNLERYSLYVNGYNEVPLEPTIQTPTSEHFTVNFTIANLRYKPEMGILNSKAFNATEMALTTLVSLAPFWIRPIKNGNETGMNSICAYRNDSTMPGFDRVKVYHEIVNKTNGFTKMGPYKLNPNSLYVNDYNEAPVQATVLPKTTPTVEHFTVNFTVTNLRYKPEMGIPNSKAFGATEMVLTALVTVATPTEEYFAVNFTVTNLRYKPAMGIPHSKAFNATEMILTTLLGRMFNRSTLGPAFRGCEVTTLRPMKHGDETGMDFICTYRKDSASPVFDRVKVYHEMVNKTNGFTKMGPYKLDPNSLYVNGNPV
ncbi:hypothetical protein JD844_034274, partial [Phrynosoma platyrhinos]